MLDNNLSEITVAYESGWNRLTEKYYAKVEWPEAEVIAPLVNDGAHIWLYECPPSKLTTASLHRPDLPHPLPRTVLPPRLLAHPARHRRPIPLLRKQLRVVQLPPQSVPLAMLLQLRRYNCDIDSDGPVSLELPEQWLWDIIDEFIYQFQSFCVWRSKVKSKTDEELMLLADASQVRSAWTCSRSCTLITVRSGARTVS